MSIPNPTLHGSPRPGEATVTVNGNQAPVVSVGFCEILFRVRATSVSKAKDVKIFCNVTAVKALRTSQCEQVTRYRYQLFLFLFLSSCLFVFV